MSQSNSARVGVLVLAIALVAVVGVLVWRSRSDDTARAAEKGTPVHKDRDRGPLPRLDNGGDEAGGEAKPQPAGGSLHDRLGGREAIHAVVGKLLEAALNNQVLMANERVKVVAKRVNVRKLHQRITNFVCKQAGGPCKYTGRPMKDYVAQLKLTSADWDALETDFANVLAEIKVPKREAQELIALFGALRDDGVTAD